MAHVVDDALPNQGEGTEHRPLHVLLIDADPLARRVIRDELMTSDRFVIVGEAEDGIAAVAMAQRRRPDVVLIDPALPAWMA